MELRKPSKLISADQSGNSPEGASQRLYDLEPFADADGAAEFLMAKRKTIISWAREGSIPAHPFGRGKRTLWRFRLSELAGYRKPVREIMKAGSPEISRPEQRNG
jgi:hypothetical protein